MARPPEPVHPRPAEAPPIVTPFGRSRKRRLRRRPKRRLVAAPHAGDAPHLLVACPRASPGLFTKRKLDAATLEDLEDALVQADLGVETAMRITEAVGEGRYDKEIAPDEVKAILAGEVERTPRARGEAARASTGPGSPS